MLQAVNDDFLSSFEELQADFYQYLRRKSGLAHKTCGDYVSRLRFIASRYLLDATITAERIKEIMVEEESNRISRPKYSSKHAMTDIHSGLMKFLEFINSDYQEEKDRLEQDEVEKIDKNTALTKTEKESIVKSRVGQGVFRKRLFE